MFNRTLLVAGVVAFSVFAQDEAAFQIEMKSIDKHAAVLRKLSAKTGDEAATNAEQLSKLYGSMKEFWTKRNVEDAAKWSEDGRMAAVELASAAKAGDAEKADTAFKALGGTCRSCHTAHREKAADGSYKIK
jgi:cytochrome c556